MSYMQGMVHLGNVLARTGRWQSWKIGPRFDEDACVFTPLSLIPFSRVWPFNTKYAAKFSYLTCIPGIRSSLQKCGKGDPDIIWSANPGSAALKKVFPNARLVFQVVDYYPAFSGSSIRAIERLDYEAADHILVIGETLKNYLLNEYTICPEKITVLGQGVFVDRYSPDLREPEELALLTGPIAIWVGVLSKGDAAMFEAAAEALMRRGGNLVLIGPAAQWSDSLANRYSNVHLLGPRMPDEVPSYLVHSDIGLMLYDQSRKEVYKGQNPLKLYEYAAAGLPTISTQHDEYDYLDAPVIIIDEPEDIDGAIQDAIDNKEDYSIRSRKFAEIRSWNSIYDVACKKVNELLESKSN